MSLKLVPNPPKIGVQKTTSRVVSIQNNLLMELERVALRKSYSVDTLINMGLELFLPDAYNAWEIPDQKKIIPIEVD